MTKQSEPSSQNAPRTAGWLTWMIAAFGLFGAVLDAIVLIPRGYPLSHMAGFVAALGVWAAGGIYVIHAHYQSRLRQIYEWSGWGLVAVLLIGYALVDRSGPDARPVSFVLNLAFAAVAGLLAVRFRKMNTLK